jgi:hypothetical protein
MGEGRWEREADRQREGEVKAMCKASARTVLDTNIAAIEWGAPPPPHSFRQVRSSLMKSALRKFAIFLRRMSPELADVKYHPMLTPCRKHMVAGIWIRIVGKLVPTLVCVLSTLCNHRRSRTKSATCSSCPACAVWCLPCSPRASDPIPLLAPRRLPLSFSPGERSSPYSPLS